MVKVRASLNSCVSDMVVQGVSGLYRNYFQKPFIQDTFEVRVDLGHNTYKVFELEIAYNSNPGQTNLTLAYVLWANNADFGRELLFQGKLALTQSMEVLDAIRCALHITGDYIKFAFKPISIDEEENHNA